MIKRREGKAEFNDKAVAAGVGSNDNLERTKAPASWLRPSLSSSASSRLGCQLIVDCVLALVTSRALFCSLWHFAMVVRCCHVVVMRRLWYGTIPAPIFTNPVKALFLPISGKKSTMLNVPRDACYSY